jgi:D-psicose/D-tagatose/L-ribulose 3-epimerase
MKYSVKSSTLLLAGLDVLERPGEVLEMVAAAGYAGVELKADAGVFPSVAVQEIINVCESIGLELYTLGGAWAAWDAGEERDLASSDDNVREAALAYSRKCIDLTADLGSSIFEVCAAPGQSEYPRSSTPVGVLRHHFIRSMREMCKYASERNVNIALEPINRYEGHPGFMNSVIDAMSVIDEAGCNNLGVLVDLFHANIEDASVYGAIRVADGRLLNVHLCDSNRGSPGTGHIDFLAVMRALYEIRYKGFLSIGFVPSVLDVSKLRETLFETSINYLQELERSSLLHQDPC